MQKAFNTINRVCLMEKLRNIGVNGYMYNAIENMYENVSCSVRVNSLMTERFDVKLGVKQGCVLSPTPFSIFVNDLARQIKDLKASIDIDGYNLSILLFVDDIALIADNPQALQAMLDTVTDWCQRWRLSIHVEKTNVGHFRTPGTVKTQFEFKCSGVGLEISESYKYLGLLLSEHIDKGRMVTAFAKSANHALGLLIAKHKALGGCLRIYIQKIISCTCDTYK